MRSCGHRCVCCVRLSGVPPARVAQARLPRKWKVLVAAVVGAHVLIAAYLAMGSRRAALLSGVRMGALGGNVSARADAWNPQVCEPI